MARTRRTRWSVAALTWACLGAVGVAGAGCERSGVVTAARAEEPAAARSEEPAAARAAHAHEETALAAGRRVFRFDTFGDEAFWGGALRLHQAIEGSGHGGVGPGVSPRVALSVGLKVDADSLDPATLDAIRQGKVDLDSPDTTLALLAQDAVVGVRAQRDARGNLQTVGITCALCHSTVDDAIGPGIGHRRDGWPNQDLNVGAIIALSPDLGPVAGVLGTDEATVRKVLAAWGPGRFDAELLVDGKGFRPDGKTAATLIPPAFGLAGVNLHTFTGWGSIPYWNAFVAVLEMHGQGSFFDPRLDDATRFPVAARNGFGHVRVPPERDRVTGQLAALHAYQLSLAAPRPPPGSFDDAAARRGAAVFAGRGQCASCHTPPLFTEGGWNLHRPEEVGVDGFQADRSPAGGYRTAPLRGLFAHARRGFYHDGRFATLGEVVDHYDALLRLGLSPAEKADLVEYLRSL